MVIEYECRICRKVISWEDYQREKFCPDCKTRLQLKIVKKNVNKKQKNKRFEIKVSDINLDSLFYKFNDPSTCLMLKASS